MIQKICHILNDRSKNNKHDEAKNMIIKEYVKGNEDVVIEERLEGWMLIFINSGSKNAY